MPQFNSKSCLIVSNHEKPLEIIKNLTQTSFLQNHNFTTEQIARRSKHSPGELTSEPLARQGKNTRCGELGSTRRRLRTLVVASDDIYSPGDQEYSLWRAMSDSSTDRP